MNFLFNQILKKTPKSKIKNGFYEYEMLDITINFTEVCFIECSSARNF